MGILNKADPTAKKSQLSFIVINMIAVVLLAAIFVIAPTVVFGEGEIHPAVYDLLQWDGTTVISEGYIMQHPSISFSANMVLHVSAPYGRLQVELRRFEEPFTGIDDGGILSSDLVPGGQVPRVTRIGLSDGTYHWRARVIDNQGNTSPWREFGNDGNVDFEIRASIIVNIDIKPGSYPNSINPNSKGKIPVAILSTSGFNAPLQIDKMSLTFGRSGNEASLAFCDTSVEDVNADSLPDLLCHFITSIADFKSGDTMGLIKGRTTAGINFSGSDSVRMVP